MEDGWIGFLELCIKAKTPKELNELFCLFMTLEEKDSLSSRFKIVKALMKKKLTQRQIAKEFNVSIAQITRGSNALKIIKPPLKRFLEKELT